MPAYFSRLTKLPEATKLVTLALSLILMFVLGTIKVHPPGVSLIWFTISMAIIFDVFTTVLILKEFDRNVMAIRMMPYAALECTGSVLIFVFFVLSVTLCISSEELTDDFGFIISAILCLLTAMGFLLNLVLNIRKWISGTHLQNPPNIYDYPSYGSE